MTVVVNFFAGPGTGKSTTTAATFAKLKMAGKNVEIAHEFAKDLTWEGRSTALKFQPYITGKQMFKVHRLIGEVEAVLTDSPILMSHVYGDKSLPESYFTFLTDMFKTWDTLNIFLERNPKRLYNPKGRRQSESEARELDGKICNMLKEFEIPYTSVPVSGDGTVTAATCTKLVMERL